MRVHAHTKGQTDARFFVVALYTLILFQQHQHPHIHHVTMLQMQLLEDEKENMLPL